MAAVLKLNEFQDLSNNCLRYLHQIWLRLGKVNVKQLLMKSTFLWLWS